MQNGMQNRPLSCKLCCRSVGSVVPQFRRHCSSLFVFFKCSSNLIAESSLCPAVYFGEITSHSLEHDFGVSLMSLYS